MDERFTKIKFLTYIPSEMIPQMNFLYEKNLKTCINTHAKENQIIEMLCASQ